MSEPTSAASGRPDLSTDDLRAIVTRIRSSADPRADAEALVERVGSSEAGEDHLLLCEALHRAGDFERALDAMRSARSNPSIRSRFDQVAALALPRSPERLRFYNCAQTVGFERKDVLEVGGKMSRDWVAPAQPSSWTCADPSVEREIDEPGYRRLQVDACDMPFEDESFDLVFSSAAFEHIPDIPAMLGELYRTLRPGGQVYSDFGPIWSGAQGHHVRSRAQKVLEDGGLWPMPPWAHLTMSRREMRAYLQQKLDDQEVRLVERWLYRRPNINRLFFEDYIHYFHASPFRVRKVQFKAGDSPDSTTLKALARRQPGRGHFEVNGFRILLSK